MQELDQNCHAHHLGSFATLPPYHHASLPSIKVGVAGEPGYCYGLDADGLGTATVWMTHEVDH